MLYFQLHKAAHHEDGYEYGRPLAGETPAQTLERRRLHTAWHYEKASLCPSARRGGLPRQYRKSEV